MIVERLLVGNLKKDLAIWRGNISLPRCESSFLISTECDAKKREREKEECVDNRVGKLSFRRLDDF